MTATTTTAASPGTTPATRQVRVMQVRWEAEQVVSLQLADPSGAALPPWQPGAHVDVVLPSGLVRQYSLCGEPGSGTYTIAVLREDGGRGGSREVHETALVGSLLTIRGPRNHFPLAEDGPYLFIAGGIGITPILAMVREASRTGRPWRLVYGGRSLRSMAFQDQLAALAADPGGQVDLVPQDEHGPLDLDGLLGSVRPGTAIHVCGPPGLIQAVERRAGVDFSPEALHVERFTSGAAPAPRQPDAQASFEVELASSGDVLTVPADKSILEVVREVRPEVMFSCEDGFCGTCETKVLCGTPEHRDTILTQADRDRNDTMMICVGRSRSDRLVLDL
jgi:ferredoxin-NADP reductase